MRDRTVIRTGAVGSLIAAICCFTPVLAIGLGALGLSAWLGWLDYVLLPALAFFSALTGYGLWRQRNTSRRGAPARERTGEGR